MEPRCYNHQNGGHDERYALSSDDELFEEVRRRNETKRLLRDDLSLISLSLIVFATRSEVRLTAYTGMILFFPLSCASYIYNKECAPRGFPTDAYLGQLVRLGFDIAVFTPASYLRHRL